MKKTVSVLVLLLLMALFADGACAKTVTPMQPSRDMDHLACQCVVAVLEDADCDARMLTFSLYEPEVYAEGDILDLAPGDVLITEGREISIVSVEPEFDCLRINLESDDWHEGTPVLARNDNGNFWIVSYATMFGMTKIGELTFTVPDNLLFLDGIEPEHGGELELPTVHTDKEWLATIAWEEKEGGAGFSARNVHMVFDADGNPAMVHRFYVHWQ